VHRRQLGSAVHVFSHIRQTLHVEELVLLAPSLAAVCPSAAAAAAPAAAAAAAALAADSGGGSGAGGGAASRKRKQPAAAAAAEGAGVAGGAGACTTPAMRWVAGADISQQGLTSGVRKVLQLSLK
jgi:hypothetical protein